jgi:hypothetical protein
MPIPSNTILSSPHLLSADSNRLYLIYKAIETLLQNYSVLIS